MHRTGLLLLALALGSCATSPPTHAWRDALRLGQGLSHEGRYVQAEKHLLAALALARADRTGAEELFARLPQVPPQ